METKPKSSWGTPKDWLTAIGILIAVVGLMLLISSVMPVPPVAPDAVAPPAGFFGANALVPSVIILVVGLVIAGVGQFFMKPKA